MLEFRPDTHEYLKGGIPVPGVTKILGAANLIDMSMVPRDILERAWAFGSAVHRATELDDQNNLDESVLDLALKPYLEAWRKFTRETSFKILAIEERVYSKKYGYAGTLDRRGMLGGKHTLVDIKTGADEGAATPIQLAAYERAWNEGKKTQEKIKERLVVRLKGDGTYVLPGNGYFKKSDFSVFLSALTLYSWRTQNGKR